MDAQQLEARGTVTRTVYPQVPPKVEYRLTGRGQALRPALAALPGWVAMRPTAGADAVADSGLELPAGGFTDAAQRPGPPAAEVAAPGQETAAGGRECDGLDRGHRPRAINWRI